MSPKVITQLRARLLEVREELRAEGDVPLEPARQEVARVGVDDDEQPIIEMTQAIASGRNRARSQRLHAIDQALRRLEAAPSEFGSCRDCGEEIATKRLNAMPWVELCIECQAREEKENASPYGRRRADDYR